MEEMRERTGEKKINRVEKDEGGGERKKGKEEGRRGKKGQR